MAPSAIQSRRRPSTGSNGVLEDLLSGPIKDIKKKSSGGGGDRDRERDSSKQHHGHRSSSRDDGRGRSGGERPRSRSRSASRNRRGRSTTDIKRRGRRETQTDDYHPNNNNNDDDDRQRRHNHRSKSKDRSPKSSTSHRDVQKGSQRTIVRVVESDNMSNVSPLSNRSMFTASLSYGTTTNPSEVSPPETYEKPKSTRTRSQSPMKRFKNMLFGGSGSGTTATHKKKVARMPEGSEFEGDLVDKADYDYDHDDDEDGDAAGALMSIKRGGKRRSSSGGPLNRPPRTPKSPKTPLKVVFQKNSSANLGTTGVGTTTPATTTTNNKTRGKNDLLPPLPLTSASNHSALSTVGTEERELDIVTEREKNKKLLKKLKLLKKQLKDYETDKDDDDDNDNDEEDSDKHSHGRSDSSATIKQLQAQLDAKDRRIDELESGTDAAIFVRLEYQLEEARRQLSEKDLLLQAQMSNLILQADRVKTLEIQLKKHYDETVPDLRKEVDQLTTEKSHLLHQLESERQDHLSRLQQKDETILEYRDELDRLREHFGLPISTDPPAATATTVGGTSNKIQQAMSCFLSPSAKR